LVAGWNDDRPVDGVSFLAPSNLKNLFFLASSPSKDALFQSFQPDPIWSLLDPWDYATMTRLSNLILTEIFKIYLVFKLFLLNKRFSFNLASLVKVLVNNKLFFALAFAMLSLFVLLFLFVLLLFLVLFLLLFFLLLLLFLFFLLFLLFLLFLDLVVLFILMNAFNKLMLEN
jgi:hypothetical protein